LTSAFAFHPSHALHRAHGAVDTKRRAMRDECPRRMVKRPMTRQPFAIDALVVGSEVKSVSRPASAAASATAREK
jgi:hypothetical protein